MTLACQCVVFRWELYRKRRPAPRANRPASPSLAANADYQAVPNSTARRAILYNYVMNELVIVPNEGGVDSPTTEQPLAATSAGVAHPPEVDLDVEPAAPAPLRGVIDVTDPAKLAEAAAARAERAAGLVRAGAVEAMGSGRYRVRSGGGGWWAVRADYCNCPDFAWRGYVPCKHLIAVELVRSFLAA